jgi:prophage regulatory protein
MTTHKRLLRRKEVERYCQIGRSTIYRLMREGLFPVPIRVGPRAVRWPEHELTAWLARRPRATGETGTSADTAHGSQPAPGSPRD